MEQNFTLCITDTKHEEWQGHITREGKSSADFQSVIELLKILGKEINPKA